MMQDNENARPDVGASERAKMEAGTGQATTSKNHDTTASPQGQAVKVADFLMKDLLHLDGRKVRLMIRAERLSGTPILADNQTGYYLPGNDHERAQCVRSMRRRAAEIVKAADAIERGG